MHQQQQHHHHHHQQDHHQLNSIVSYDHFQQAPNFLNHHHNHHHNHNQRLIMQQSSGDDPLHQIQSHSQMRTKQCYLQNNYNQNQLKQLASYAVAQQQQRQQQLHLETCPIQTPADNHFAGTYETTNTSLASPLNQQHQQQLVLYQPAASSVSRARVVSVSGDSMLAAPHAQVTSQLSPSTSPPAIFNRSNSFSAPLRRQQHSSSEFVCSPSQHLLNSANDSTYLSSTGQAFPYANQLQLATGGPYGSLSPGAISPSAASSSSMSGAGVSAGPSRQQANSPCSSMSPSDALSLGINLEQYISKRNERERSRVRNVNDAFDNLKKSLPLDNERLAKRMSKVEILRTAINYIRNLEGVLGCKQEQKNSKSGSSSSSSSSRLFEHHQDESSSEAHLDSKRTRASPTDCSPSSYLAEPLTSLHLSAGSAASPTTGAADGSDYDGGGADGGGGEKGGGTIAFRHDDTTFTCRTGRSEPQNPSPARLPTTYAATEVEVDHQYRRQIQQAASTADRYEVAAGEPSQGFDRRQIGLSNWEVRTNSFNCSTVYQDDHLRNYYHHHYDEQQPFQGSR